MFSTYWRTIDISSTYLWIIYRVCLKVSTCWRTETTGGGGNFHYKGIYRCAAGMGYTFQASQYMNGYHFYIRSISMGYLFHQKSIWMGKSLKNSIWMGSIFKNSIWMGSIFDMGSIWMGHVFHLAWYMNGVGFGDSSRTSVPKIMESYPPWQKQLLNLFTKIRQQTNVLQIIDVQYIYFVLLWYTRGLLRKWVSSMGPKENVRNSI